MKKIIFRKLIFDCLLFFVISLLGISSIIWVFQAVNFLDIIIEDGRNYNIYLTYTILNFPKILSKVLPFCLFFSFSYVFIKYEMRNELIIFWNHGVKKISVINLFLFLSLFVLTVQSLMLTIIIPKSEQLARSQLRSSDVDYFEALIKPRKFNDTVKGLTIFADDKNSKNEFINIYIKKITKDSFQITYAKKGIFEKKGDRKVLVLYDGQTLSSKQNKITNFSFSKSDFGLENMSSHRVVDHRKLQEQKTKDLIECFLNIYFKQGKRILNCDQGNPRNIYRELFERLVTPLYLPLLIMIASMNILFPKENIRYLRYRFFIFLFGLSMIILSESSMGFIDNSFIKIIFLISIPVILILFIYSILLYKLRLGKFKT